MVFDKSGKFEGKEKKPRIKVEGKLIGINCNSEYMKAYDQKAGKYSWVQLAIVVGKDNDGSDIYKNITAYDIKFDEMPELKRADDLTKEKNRPKVSLECYEVTKPAVDKVTNQPIMEEITENRNGKEVIVQRQKNWVNYRMTEDDVKKSFKILADNFDNEPDIKPVGKDEIIVG